MRRRNAARKFCRRGVDILLKMCTTHKLDEKKRHAHHAVLTQREREKQTVVVDYAQIRKVSLRNGEKEVCPTALRHKTYRGPAALRELSALALPTRAHPAVGTSATPSQAREHSAQKVGCPECCPKCSIASC